MPEDQFKAFQAAVEADAGLQEQLKAVTDPDAVVAIAKAAGFVITAEELKRAQAEISEDELAGVTGGFRMVTDILSGKSPLLSMAFSQPASGHKYQ